MKAIERAVIIGNQTAGRVLIMKAKALSNGAVMVYPFGQTLTAKYEVLEGNGVVPDIETVLSIEEIRDGVDRPLDTAIEYILKKGGN